MDRNFKDKKDFKDMCRATKSSGRDFNPWGPVQFLLHSGFFHAKPEKPSPKAWCLWYAE